MYVIPRFAALVAVALSFALSGCQESGGSDESPSGTAAPAGSVEAELAEARAAIQTGRVADAITRVWGIVEAHPTHVGARTLLANAYVIERRYADALKEADAALAQDGKAADAWVAKGAALMGLDKPGEAIDATKKATRYDTDNLAAWRNLSKLYREAQDLKRERRALEKWVAAAPDEATPRILVARNHSARGDHKSALRAAYEASRRAPEDPDIQVFLAATHLELDDYDMAMDHSDIANKLQPDREDARQIFEAAFYVSATSTLTCSKGPAPWERTDVEGVLLGYLQEGVRNVDLFYEFHKRFKDDPAVTARLARAMKRCEREVRAKGE